MRILWNLVKLVVALCLIIPLTIIALAITLGIFGTLLGLAILALRIAIIGLVGYGMFRLFMALFRPSRSHVPEVKSLPPVDPYYEQAKRELDQELGHSR